MNNEFNACAWGSYNRKFSYAIFDVTCYGHHVSDVYDNSSKELHRLAQYRYDLSKVIPTSSSENRPKNILIRVFKLLS